MTSTRTLLAYSRTSRALAANNIILVVLASHSLDIPPSKLKSLFFDGASSPYGASPADAQEHLFVEVSTLRRYYTITDSKEKSI